MIIRDRGFGFTPTILDPGGIVPPNQIPTGQAPAPPPSGNVIVIPKVISTEPMSSSSSSGNVTPPVALESTLNFGNDNGWIAPVAISLVGLVGAYLLLRKL
jgi:hypothetical protein